jgi:hypothetical protein
MHTHNDVCDREPLESPTRAREIAEDMQRRHDAEMYDAEQLRLNHEAFEVELAEREQKTQREAALLRDLMATKTGQRPSLLDVQRALLAIAPAGSYAPRNPRRLENGSEDAA